jgi:holin-like protein
MLRALTLLVVCQFVGEVAAGAVALPVPGPVIGLLLLLGLLVGNRRWRGREPGAGLRETAGALLGNLELLFVPAGVGVVTQLPALAHAAVPVIVSILVSTLLGLLVTGVVMQRLLRD